MKKTLDILKKGLDIVITFFKSLTIKKGLILFFSVFLLTVLTVSFFKVSDNHQFYETQSLSYDYSNQTLSQAYEQTLYSELKQGYLNQNIEDANVERTIVTSEMQGEMIDLNDDEYQDIVDDYLASNQTSDHVFLLSETTDISWTHDEAQSGLYYFAIDYYELQENIDQAQIAISVNGEPQFYEAQTLVLNSKWVYETYDFALDRYENEIMPSSNKIKDWYNQPIYDYRGMHPGYFGFYLEQGDEITISFVNQEVLIGQVYYINNVSYQSYESYLDMYPNAEVIDDQIMISARNILYRNNPSIRLRTEQDPSNMYYDTQFLRLNVIFGDSWQNSGDKVTYEVEVEKSGFYHLSFKYRQYMIKDLPVYKKISIDGEVPFDLFESYAFPYTTNFINRTLTDENNEFIKVYLEAGTHEITLESVNYPYRDIIETVQYVMQNIQSLSLEIKRYTAGGTDRYRDWDIELYFPNAESDIRDWALLLEDTYNAYIPLSDIEEPAEIANLKVAATRLNNIADDINQLPSMMVQFSDGDSSVNQILGNLMENLLRTNMEMERMIVHGDTDIPKPYANFFVRFFEGAKRLVLSFINNPYSASDRNDEDLTVWVNHPRQYIEIMQRLIDQNYTGNRRVTLSQMPDQNKLVLANASGQAPDLAIGVDHWIPYDFAVRDAALDLRQFQGYEESVSKFAKGAMIPYVFEDGVYALPETQDFWVTYYRRDILNSIGITEIPQTWEEIIEILPLLQSYGMNYFVPIAQFSGLKPYVATLPFIYQFGGDLYAPDGMSTAINSEQTLEGITLMSDLFTLYNLPKYVPNFYNHFRYGLLPIGISNLATYILLETAAVELDGLWAMDLHPGVYNEETDEIIRYSSVGGQASMIMSSTAYPEEAWDFLEWWMSTSIQSEFAFLLQSTYGQAYFWNTANMEAFETISMPDEYKDIILAQWEYGMEASRIPGAYMVERSISNAWTSIVFEGTNPRQALDEAVRVSDREIIYKMAEFGYTENGVIVKEYIVPSIYNIDRWLTEVNHD